MIELLIINVVPFVSHYVASFLIAWTQPFFNDVVNKDVHNDLVQIISTVVVSGIVGLIISIPQLIFDLSWDVFFYNWGIIWLVMKATFHLVWKRHPIRIQFNKWFPGVIEHKP